MVTIAIASYNNGLYIERCIESVINQSYNDLDILIVDDGSSDDTLKKLENYRHEKRIRFIVKNNGGLSSVRQMALDEALGEYICFIDADDYLLPLYVEKMFLKMEHDLSDVCVCSTRFENVDGNELPNFSESFRCFNSLKPIATSWQAYSNLKKYGIDKLYLSDSWNKMYRVSSLKETEVKFHMPKGLNGSDSNFNLVLALHTLKYSTIEDVGYVHVIYNHSAVHRKNKNLNKSFRIIISDMIEESIKLDIFDKIKQYISLKWYSVQEGIFDDYYHGCGKPKTISECFQFKKMQDDFAKEKSLKQCSLMMADTKKERLFLFVYKYAIFLLPFYFKLVHIYTRAAQCRK